MLEKPLERAAQFMAHGYTACTDIILKFSPSFLFIRLLPQISCARYDPAQATFRLIKSSKSRLTKRGLQLAILSHSSALFTARGGDRGPHPIVGPRLRAAAYSRPKDVTGSRP
jgi:hypothetical protein